MPVLCRSVCDVTVVVVVIAIRPPSSDSTGAQTGNDLSARSARRHMQRPKFEKVRFLCVLPSVSNVVISRV